MSVLGGSRPLLTTPSVSPTITFLLVTVLSGSAALFLVEAMASIAGNEKFQAVIEYSTLADLLLGHRWHWAFQIILYIALQSQTITSLIESFQVPFCLLTYGAVCSPLLTHYVFFLEYGYISRKRSSQIVRSQLPGRLGMRYVMYSHFFSTIT